MSQWSSCVGISVDNTSYIVGKRESITTRDLERNKCVYMYFMSCPSHIIHNCASHSSNAFVKAIKCDVGDMAVDVFFWFEYSTKRKNLLAEFCQFCDRVQKDNKVDECPSVESCINIL